MRSEVSEVRDARLSGRTVVVTGAGRGIGEAVAHRVAEAGARALCLDVDGAAAEATAEAVGGVAFQVDISDEAQVRDAVADIVLRGPVHGLCNVAGIAGPQTPAGATPLDEWEATYAVNLRGTFLMCRAMLPHLVRTRGVIVNIASALAHIGWREEAAYGPTKAAVVQLTKSIALDYAPHVRANTVSPGAVLTPMIQSVLDETGADPDEYGRVHPLGGHLLPPRAIADACLFLLSDDASFVTGADLPVDAGMLAIGRSTMDLTH